MPTVAEFINHLKQFPADAPVALSVFNGYFYFTDDATINVRTEDLVNQTTRYWVRYEELLDGMNLDDPEDAEIVAELQKDRHNVVVISSEWIDENARTDHIPL
jgi:hypothetical protein